MLERTTNRSLALINRAVDLAPAAQACCGVCRSCLTTNVFTLAAAGLVAAAGYSARFIRRLAGT